MPTTPCFHVDAFTTAAFRGNPAAVCLLAAPRPAKWMQAVAAEMNLSETAFVRPIKRGFQLRWFTPTVEVDLCGHATLATAHVLWQEGIAPRTAPLVFHTRSGALAANVRGQRIELDFPACPVAACKPPAGLLSALGTSARFVGRNRDDFLIEVATEREVRSLSPALDRLAAVRARGIIVTARGSSRHHFVSRFFAPAVGVPEDPVTGSAHCALAPYWQQRLSRARLRGYQASARGGTVEVEVRGDRVSLLGNAVTVLRGELLA